MIPVLSKHMRGASYPREVSIVVEDAYQQEVFTAAAQRLAGGAEAAK